METSFPVAQFFSALGKSAGPGSVVESKRDIGDRCICLKHSVKGQTDGGGELCDTLCLDTAWHPVLLFLKA